MNDVQWKIAVETAWKVVFKRKIFWTQRRRKKAVDRKFEHFLPFHIYIQKVFQYREYKPKCFLLHKRKLLHFVI